MTQNHPQWQRIIPEPLVSSDQVHVWRIFLDVNVHEIESLLGHLSADEVSRASRFRFEKDKIRFIAAHGILRRILGHYLQQYPQKIRFAYAPNGKPILADGLNATTLSFNLSHSGGFALCAITLHRKVGVDIEFIRHDVAVEQIARRFFSQSEVRSLESMQKHELYETFYRYWTRKEAFLKATGDGLSLPMEKIDVSAISGKTLSPATLLRNEKENVRWYVQDLFPGEGYTGAIAVEAACCRLTYLQYSL
ncbi:MAG TPA: 4'-phosphopantetheinyl transferase superfamily protein [Flavisolibacter sp.]|nr:4'-phosphopantetheinyl transferase superfamily protein [Flavisolibacter sp.]